MTMHRSVPVVKYVRRAQTPPSHLQTPPYINSLYRCLVSKQVNKYSEYIYDTPVYVKKNICIQRECKLYTGSTCMVYMDTCQLETSVGVLTKINSLIH